MKPDWKDAPEWAECLLRNNEGEWFWSEKMPSYFLTFEGDIEWQVQGKVERAGDGHVRYHPCYEMRPDHILDAGKMIIEENT